MLTRLRVSGFKNLVDVDVRFGPFTCIAGPNGVGKSNLFDAILFLRDLADKPFVEAAANVRGGEDATLLFTPNREQMTLIAELLIPQFGVDEFGQHTSAASTLLEYSVTLALVNAQDGLGKRIALRMEEPENGIHPARIDAMLSLLHDIAVDTEYPIGDDNPLRQIIINTHSPAVAGLVEEADLLFAESLEIRSSMSQELLDDERTRASVAFRPIESTWRCQWAERAASGHTGRRLRKFSAARAVHRLSEYLHDFSPLRQLPSFRSFEADLRAVASGLEEI